MLFSSLQVTFSGLFNALKTVYNQLNVKKEERETFFLFFLFCPFTCAGKRTTEEEEKYEKRQNLLLMHLIESCFSLPIRSLIAVITHSVKLK